MAISDTSDKPSGPPSSEPDDTKSANAHEGIGYGKPPIATRFQPGKSGNPNGRPKVCKSQATLLRAELERPYAVNFDGKKQKFTADEIITKKLVNIAMNGHLGAIKVVQSQREKLRIDEPMSITRIQVVFVDPPQWPDDPDLGDDHPSSPRYKLK